MEVSHGKWVSSVQDDKARVISSTACAALSLLSDDGEVKLIVAHAGSRYDTWLKVFKGVALVSESRLADLPVAICPFQNEQNSSPAIAVASGPSILCYKNLRPFYKVSRFRTFLAAIELAEHQLQPLDEGLEINYTPKGPELHPIELEAWAKADLSELSADELYTVLDNLSKEIPISQLSALSQTMLVLPKEEWSDYVHHFSQKALKSESPLTCMTTMKKSQAETVDFLVIGTERGEIQIVDGQAFLMKETAQLPSTPTGIVSFGFYDVDFRLFVSTRNSQIFSIKRGVKQVERPIITTSTAIVSFTRLNKMLVVACADNNLYFFSFKGKRLNLIKIGEPIIVLEPFFYAPRQVSAVLVLLYNEVRMYTEQYQIDVLKINRQLQWIRYGPFGREEACLVLGTRDGGLMVKILRRRAHFDERVNPNVPVDAHQAKVSIPKKTKAFVDQTVREKEQASAMNQAYQKDLFLLKYKATKAFAEMTSTAATAIATDKQEALDISVEVHGFGPAFRITIRVNSSAQQPLFGMWLTLIGGNEMYRFESSLIPVSSIFPGRFYTYTTMVHCLNPENGLSGEIRVLLVRPNRPTPIVSAVVAMPISEMSLLD